MSFDKNKIKGYLLLKDIEVVRANALSGHLVYGFPSVTAFKGFAHAMARTIVQKEPVSLRGVLIASHYCEVYGQEDSTKHMRFSQFSFPATTMRHVSVLKKGRLPPISEQAYVDMRVSLVIEVVADKELNEVQKDTLTKEAYNFTKYARIAGGKISHSLKPQDIRFVEYEDLDDIAYEINNSYVLTDAEELMRQYLSENSEQNALDAVMQLTASRFVPTSIEGEDGSLTGIDMVYEPHEERYRGLVAISKGYQGIAPALKNKNFKGSRAQKEEGITQYVETVYGLAKWELPHVLRVKGFLREAFWVYEHDKQNSLYTVSQSSMPAMYL